METKTDKAIRLYKQGLIKESLAIFKTFRLGFTKEEIRSLEIASECLNGFQSFYQKIGINTEYEISRSHMIISAKYNI